MVYKTETTLPLSPVRSVNQPRVFVSAAPEWPNQTPTAETLLPLLQVPDYLMVIKKPMDLSTLLTNIDQHKYVTVGEFMADADFIWKNALEYNPDSDPMGETTSPVTVLLVCPLPHSLLPFLKFLLLLLSV